MSVIRAEGRPPVPVLLLFADTGGGHRSAARAVAEALLHQPERFTPVLLDPLCGPDSSWPLRRIVRLYGPVIRYAPWAWGAFYRATNSRRVMRLLRRAMLRLASRPVVDAVARIQPGLIVSCHPLTTEAALSAGRRGQHRTPVATLVTDLVSVHAAWPHQHADLVVVASAAARQRCVHLGVSERRCVELGLPVSSGFRPGPARRSERDRAPSAAGVAERPLRVVVTGGGEGSGGIARRASALIRQFSDIEVVAICGRNHRARRKLAKLAARSAGRLTVHGSTTDMAGWLPRADVVATKAGPGTIAEATCCGTALLITSYLPGQEDGNVDLVVTAGAGRYVPRVADLVSEVARLRADPAALDTMRAASERLARPLAAAESAAVLGGLAGVAPQDRVRPQAGVAPQDRVRPQAGVAPLDRVRPRDGVRPQHGDGGRTWQPLPPGWPAARLTSATREARKERHGNHSTAVKS